MIKINEFTDPNYILYYVSAHPLKQPNAPFCLTKVPLEAIVLKINFIWMLSLCKAGQTNYIWIKSIVKDNLIWSDYLKKLIG